jgi:hypothetical protein
VKNNRLKVSKQKIFSFCLVIQNAKNVGIIFLKRQADALELREGNLFLSQTIFRNKLQIKGCFYETGIDRNVS